MIPEAMHSYVDRLVDGSIEPYALSTEEDGFSHVFVFIFSTNSYSHAHVGASMLQRAGETQGEAAQPTDSTPFGELSATRTLSTQRQPGYEA